MKNKLFSISVFALCSLLLFVSCDKKEQDKKAEAAQATEIVTDENAPETTPGGMALLKSGDVAFAIDDFEVTWQELYTFLLQNGLKISRITLEGERTPTPTDAGEGAKLMLPPDEERAMKLTGRLIRNLLLLDEAHRQGQDATDEDIVEYTKRLASTYPGDINEYLRRFPEKTDDKLAMTRRAMFTLAKFTDSLLEGLEVPEEAVDLEINKLKSENKIYTDMTAQARMTFQELSVDPRINTDEGFAEMAREYSEGREANNGGVINQLATREQIAEANDGQPFTTPVGQTSPMIETETAFRYIRVLASVPGQDGQPERLRIAQILYPKLYIRPLPSRDDVREQLKYKLSESNINFISEQMLAQRTFRCPLFPAMEKKQVEDRRKALSTEQENTPPTKE